MTDVEVAYYQSPNSVTTYSPFYMVYEFEPKIIPFDIIKGSADVTPATTEWLSKLKAAHKSALASIERANAYRAR